MAQNAAYDEACVIGGEWERLGERLIGKRPEIALVVDPHALHALRWFPIDRGLSYNDAVRWMYDSLYEMNLACDVVYAKELIPERYKMIITPALYTADEALLDKLDRFVARGGTLVGTFRSFVADEHLSVWPETLPCRLHPCFGAYYRQFTDPGRATVAGHPVRHWMDLLICGGAEVLAVYDHPH